MSRLGSPSEPSCSGFRFFGGWCVSEGRNVFVWGVVAWGHRRLRESWPFRHIEKKGDFFGLILG